MDLENGLENTQKNEQRLLYDFLSSSTIFVLRSRGEPLLTTLKVGTALMV